MSFEIIKSKVSADIHDSSNTDSPPAGQGAMWETEVGKTTPIPRLLSDGSWAQLLQEEP